MDHSIRRKLLQWVLFPLALAVAVSTWLNFLAAQEASLLIQDRLLLGSARMIAEQISFESGAFQHQIPPAAIELFQSGTADRVYYRVTAGNGQLLAGYTEFPLPIDVSEKNSPQFFDSSIRGKPVRVVAFVQPVVGYPSMLPAIVEVGQTINARKQVTFDLWFQGFRQQTLLLIFAVILMLFGLNVALRPLILLRNQVSARKEGALDPIEVKNVPSELVPFVISLNEYIYRLERYMSRNAVFVQNAAHQLRNPLAVLGTQISDARIATNREGTLNSLNSAQNTLYKTTRIVNQYLLLSSVESSKLVCVTTPIQAIADIVQETLEDFAIRADRSSIDLGFERNGPDVDVSLNLIAVREILSNMVDNAIRYKKAAGIVTVYLTSSFSKVLLIVEDNGPGIPDSERSRIFERFYRGVTTLQDGSGLGLAIVKELVEQCGGSVKVNTSRGGLGLAFEVSFPALPQ